MNQSADKAALFNSLHQEYDAMVNQLCLGYSKGDRAASQDLVQEVFINIWNGLDKFRSESSYKTWIYRITVNTCLLYLRSLSKQQATTELTEGHFYKAQGTDVYGEPFQELYKAIGELPHLDRLIMMLLLEQLPYNEISSITGIGAVHLRVKIHRIKAKMRQLIKE